MIFSRISNHIGSAMHHLYTRNYLHRDIKLRNTAFEMVNGQLVFKLIDFGSAIYNVPPREIGWQVDRQSFREMIMSILTWDILPKRAISKRIIVNDEYTQVTSEDGKYVDTPLPFSWLAINGIIDHVRTSPLSELAKDAQTVRKYDKFVVKKAGNTALMTMAIGDVDVYYAEMCAAF